MRPQVKMILILTWAKGLSSLPELPMETWGYTIKLLQTGNSRIGEEDKMSKTKKVVQDLYGAWTTALLADTAGPWEEAVNGNK